MAATCPRVGAALRPGIEAAAVAGREQPRPMPSRRATSGDAATDWRDRIRDSGTSPSPVPKRKNRSIGAPARPPRTNVPLPWRRSIRPSCASNSRALRNVPKATPCSAARRVSAGRATPGAEKVTHFLCATRAEAARPSPGVPMPSWRADRAGDIAAHARQRSAVCGDESVEADAGNRLSHRRAPGFGAPPAARRIVQRASIATASSSVESKRWTSTSTR